MKKTQVVLTAVLTASLFGGCNNKEVKVETDKTLSTTKVSQEKKSVANDIAVEILPVSDKKVEVITKVKPEINVVTTEKLDKGEVPVVVVEPVSADMAVKEVEILPVKDNKLDIVTKVQPTIEVVEELPIEGEIPELVIEPLVK